MRLKDPELCKLFAAESAERLARIESGLARLGEASPEEAPEIRSELMREAHTLKGAARMAGLDDVGHLAHCLEDALADAGNRASAARTIHATLVAIRTLTHEATRGPNSNMAPLVVTPFVEHPPRSALSSVATRAADATLMVEAPIVERVLALSAEALAALHEPAHLGEILPRLHAAARALRDVPFSSITKPLQRTAQEVARARSKDVYLLVEGGAIRMEPRTLDALKGALLHMLHNAIDHGIETPEERRAAGKISTGLITVTASVDGHDLVIEVADDGRGIDEASVLAAALRRGLSSGPAGPEDAAAARRRAEIPESGKIEDLVFLPGFTTRSDVSETSGRGVGLDAVRAVAEALGGSVALESTPGQGCIVRVRVPASP